MKESMLGLKAKTTHHWLSYLKISCKY